MPAVLFEDRQARSLARDLFSAAAGWVFRRNRFERGIAWRAADSLAPRSFLGYELSEAPPDHSTISRTRRLIDLEIHKAVFGWVLKVLAEEGLLKGSTVAIDGATLEANAALRSIVRRDTGEAYDDFLERLAKESGIQTPTREQLAKLDRKRRKKGSNEEWKNPHDPDARITKMKDGRTHLAHKAEHAVDLETARCWLSPCSEPRAATRKQSMKRWHNAARTSAKLPRKPTTKQRANG